MHGILVTLMWSGASKGVLIIYVPRGAADLGAGAEKSCRDLGGEEKNPVDV